MRHKDHKLVETYICNLLLFSILGAMVNISSIASSSGHSPIHYGSSKAALDQITRCMAVELGPHNIRVNAVRPSLLDDTAMSLDIFNTYGSEILAFMKQRIPLGKWPKTEQVVNTVLYLLSDKADMISGSLLLIDGGQLCT